MVEDDNDVVDYSSAFVTTDVQKPFCDLPPPSNLILE